jgi:hypothetical protein
MVNIVWPPLPGSMSSRVNCDKLGLPPSASQTAPGVPRLACSSVVR